MTKCHTLISLSQWMGGKVDRSGDERRTGHKRLGDEGDGESDGKVTESQERDGEGKEKNNSQKIHVGVEGQN